MGRYGRVPGIVFILCFVGVAGMAADAQAVDVPRERLVSITVLPEPKQMELDESGTVLIDRDGAPRAIVIIGNTMPMERDSLAAGEINARLADLGAKPLPVKLDSEVSQEDMDNHTLILIGNQEQNKVCRQYWEGAGAKITATMPPEQGYVIRTLPGKEEDAGTKIFLAGTDSMGSVYAAVTFRRLIIPHEGRIIAVNAYVRDWPDFPFRMVTGKMNESSTVDLDFCFRHKMNYFGFIGNPISTVYGYYGADHPRRAKEFYEAKRRGFTIMGALFGVNYEPLTAPILEPEKSMDRLLEEWDCMKNMKTNWLLCYSRDDQIRKYASMTADSLKRLNQDSLMIHEVMNTYFHKRCKTCRERFGNNRAAAMTNYFTIFYEELRKVLPDADLLYITIPYQWIGDKESAAILRYYTENLPFDEHTYVCVREASRDMLEAWHKTWGRDKQTWYFAEFAWGWSAPMYSVRPSMNKTFDFGKRDIIWNSIDHLTQPMPHQAMLAAEFYWNSHATGSRYWPDLRAYNNNSDVEKNFRALFAPDMTREDMHHLHRACREVWGDKAGEIMTRMFDSGLNINFAADPDYFRKRISNGAEGTPVGDLTDDDYDEMMFRQRDAARRAASAADDALKAKDEITAYGRNHFSRFCAQAHLCRIFTEANCLMIEAKRLIGADEDGAAREKLDEAVSVLSEGRKHMERLVSSDLKDFPAEFKAWEELGVLLEAPVYSASKESNAAGQLDALEKKINDTWEQREAIRVKSKTRQQSRREDAGKFLADRTLRARAVKEPLVIDGNLDEAAWQSADWAGGFGLHDRPQPAVQQTRAAFLYDDKHIYAGVQCDSPYADTTSDTAHERDTWSDKENYAEVFLKPAGDMDDYFQFQINTLGPRGDYYYMKKSDTRNHEAGWNPGWEAKIARRDKGWTAELAIPVAVLTATRLGEKAHPRTGKRWHVNVTRSTPGGPGNEYSALRSYDYHDVEHFSELVFE